jgi:hypothetical protein
MVCAFPPADRRRHRANLAVVGGGLIVGGLIPPRLIANDRPPKQASRFVRFWPPQDRPALPPGTGDADAGGADGGSV